MNAQHDDLERSPKVVLLSILALLRKKVRPNKVVGLPKKIQQETKVRARI